MTEKDLAVWAVFGPSKEMSGAEYPDLEPYPFKIKAAAKSSTNVLNASVCQSCGCKLDGKTLTRACDCRCHKEGVR